MIAVGDSLPPFEIHLTLQRLVMEAAANRDFMPIHHDRDFARASGAPDAYANTFFLQSLCEITLRRWMGPAGRLKKLEINMLQFNCVGDRLACCGTVRSVRIEAALTRAELALWVESQRGHTVSASATVELHTLPIVPGT